VVRPQLLARLEAFHRHYRRDSGGKRQKLAHLYHQRFQGLELVERAWFNNLNPRPSGHDHERVQLLVLLCLKLRVHERHLQNSQNIVF